MRLAIISDTHDQLPNFRKAIDWIEKDKIKTIIHCGDIFTPGFLKEAIDNFSGKVHLVFGNTDEECYFTDKIDRENQFSNAVFYGEKGEIKIGGKNIAFVHFPEFARGLAATGKYDLVFYGHTHKPWEEKIAGCRLVNPGNLAGIFYKATFAVYDFENEKLELKILEKLL